jgi:hypothetical protein
MATSVLAYLESEPDVFSILLKLVQSANLEDALSNPDAALTLFAPVTYNTPSHLCELHGA